MSRQSRKEEIIEYRKSGHTIKETAERFGVGTQHVKHCCAGLNIGYAESGPIKSLEEREADAIRQIEDAHAGVEYVDGFTDTDSRVNVRCKCCGTVFSVNMSKFRGRTKNAQCCKICSKAYVRNTLVIKTYMREWMADENEREREATKKRSEHKCANCGKMTTRRKYCSKECARMAANRAKELKDRNFQEKQIIDKDITLQKLFLRDRGVCWICGLMCDYSDFKRTDKAFIAGDLYPSIDHIRPRCEGGEHSWKNVKLAHRKCNSARYYTDKKKNTRNHTFGCDTLAG